MKRPIDELRELLLQVLDQIEAEDQAAKAAEASKSVPKKPKPRTRRRTKGKP